ncbi:MAG: enoyl-CoA hydratase-related protein [Chloroflexi bacterium]|nr:enoyl-CoA hydratase-related protein [Chloroflexota bacterium]MDA1004558.1 enoyl-CoA hydratase-related protein [Chloroflexota bacterium]
MSEDVLIEVDTHGVMLVTLNRPERMNSLSGDLISGVMGAIDRASKDDDVRALVLTGNGRAFCAGAEVSENSNPSAGGGRQKPPRNVQLDHFSSSGRMAEAFANCDVPVIGAINGVAAGGGFGIAMCMDVRFMAESARIGTIFIKRGIAADYGLAYWLPRLVGPAKAYELIYDGNLIDAARCLELGLANRVYPDEQLLEETLAYARRIAAGPPLAYTYVRRLMRRSLDQNLHDSLELEWTYQSSLLRTGDAREGFASFLERREPKFSGE